MKENILVVDDERGQAEILKVILEREGYNISLAFDGKGALAAFLRSSPSLVLTDLKMPDMSGLELMDPDTQELSRNPDHHYDGPRDHRQRCRGHKEGGV